MTTKFLTLSNCCGFYPATEDGADYCGSCLLPVEPGTDRHHSECVCSECETDRALDESADSYYANCED